MILLDIGKLSMKFNIHSWWTLLAINAEEMHTVHDEEYLLKFRANFRFSKTLEAFSLKQRSRQGQLPLFNVALDLSENTIRYENK